MDFAKLVADISRKQGDTKTHAPDTTDAGFKRRMDKVRKPSWAPEPLTTKRSGRVAAMQPPEKPAT